MRQLLLPLLTACAFFASIAAFPCQPVPGTKIPSLAENFKSAKFIFFGTLLKKTELDNAKDAVGIQYRIEFQIEKTYKGPVSGTALAHTFSNTCNAFGQFASPGDKCIVFVAADGRVITGDFDGPSSECIPESAPRSKKLAVEFETKLKNLQN